MEATTTPTPEITTTAVATPTPATAPSPTPTPSPAPMVQSAPIMQEGGDISSGDTKSFFKSLNWLEVGFSVLGVAGLAFVIYYYRFKLKQDKMVNNELQRQIDEIKMNVQGLMKGKYKTT